MWIWGRCVNDPDSMRRFLQFLVPTNFLVADDAFVCALGSFGGRPDPPGPILSTVQFLWIHIIMGIGALALATDPASPVVLDQKPDKKTDTLITVDMMKQFLGSFYVILITFPFHFFGSEILGFRHTDDSTLKHHKDIVRTLVFNMFVFMEIFNSVNCRRLDKKLNVFEGMWRNWYFMAITTIEVALQVLVCSFGGSAFDVTRMGAREWCISVALSCGSLPVGAVIRLLPNEPLERVFLKQRSPPPKSEPLNSSRHWARRPPWIRRATI
ncbi:hypothetical protein EDB92DRAFT_1806951 [Lactarius akahatsu]|uniref:Cation-transporting P-type ATPase C-terminal domain-containing protein n=1 Tax=Lactarius akahatsu TaxID=416441 RepID=A0AAD4Q835_9AGAM|nr:hypothetical protein EDB92DRAFT_1806951 [Lactarius akahatsu]